MHLSELKLWNFRKFGNSGAFSIESPNLKVSFLPGLNILIGENDSGKSAIVDAIKLVLKTHSLEWVKISWDDFFNNSTRLRIELIFRDLKPDEAQHFLEWLSWDGEGNNAKPYLRLIYDVNRDLNNTRILPADVKAGNDIEGITLTAQAKEYLKVTYLKPLRDAQSELIPKKGSRLSQILLGHEAFGENQSPHYLITLFSELNDSLEKYFEGKDKNGVEIEDQKGKELKALIDSFIKSFNDPTKTTQFETSQAKIKEILERLELSIKDVANPGLGTLNRLFMAAELLHLHKNHWGGLRLGLVEEIEAHLHPQVQMQVTEALELIISKLKESRNQLQLILTTHSPNIASKVKLNKITICHSNHVYSLSKGNTKLNASDYKFLERFLDVTKANLFFARGIILVEGWAEEILLPAIAKSINLNLTEKGVSVINVGSTAFLRYSRIFQRLQEPKMLIPVAIITDLDKKPNVNPVIIADSIAAKRARYDGEPVKTFISPEWTLEYCLAKSASLQSEFERATKHIHSGSDWSNFESELVRKLEKKKFKKVEVASILARIIESRIGTPNQLPIDRTDSYISYIIEALEYACHN